jgi:hypothetical protein
VDFPGSRGPRKRGRRTAALDQLALDPNGTIGRLYDGVTPNIFVVDRDGRVAYMGAILVRIAEQQGLTGGDEGTAR